MGYLIVKGVLSGALVVGVSEIAKRSTLFAAVFASLPLTSILAMIWLYLDSRSTESVRALSIGIFWMVLPSLFFFAAFPLLTKLGLKFYPALCLSSLSMALVYWGYLRLLATVGIKL